MSLKLNDNNIASAKLNENEIGVAYLNGEIVFNHDAPVWLVRTYKSFMYSFDGITFKPLATYTDGENDIGQACVCNGNFVMNRANGGNKLISIPIKKVREKILQWNSINVPTTSGTTTVASDGNQCLLTTGNSSSYDNKIYYSLDGGTNWSTKSVFTCAFRITYISNGRFWLGLNTGEQSTERKGRYWYWDKSQPSNYYYIEYQLPNGDTVDREYWCTRVQYCNGNYYVSVGNGSPSTQRGQYRGTMSKARTKLNCSDIDAGNNKFLTDITYIYGKYYAILMIQNDGFDNDSATSRNLYTSTDGITFTRTSNYFPGLAYNMFKANGKLSVYGKNFIGQIQPDETLQYTSISDNEYQTGQLVCNKFQKI